MIITLQNLNSFNFIVFHRDELWNYSWPIIDRAFCFVCLSIPFSLPNVWLFPLSQGLISKGKRCPLLSMEHLPPIGGWKQRRKAVLGDLTCLWGLGVPAHLTHGGSAEVTAGWHRTGLKPIWHSLTDVKSITPVISLREALREPVPQGSNNSFTH